MKTKRKIQIGGKGLQGFRVWCHFLVLTYFARAGFSRKDVLAALRTQSRTHGFRTGVCSDSLYINMVDIQITNLAVERKIFAEQKKKRLAWLRIEFSQHKNFPSYLSFLLCLFLFYVSREFFHVTFLFTWLLSYNLQKEDNQLSLSLLYIYI